MIRRRLSFVLGWVGRAVAACEHRRQRDCPVARHVSASLDGSVVDLDEDRLFAGSPETLDLALYCHHDCEAAGPLHALIELGRVRAERDRPSPSDPADDPALRA